MQAFGQKTIPHSKNLNVRSVHQYLYFSFLEHLSLSSNLLFYYNLDHAAATNIHKSLSIIFVSFVESEATHLTNANTHIEITNFTFLKLFITPFHEMQICNFLRGTLAYCIDTSDSNISTIYVHICVYLHVI